jgi:glycosyltransferase involved in cell wall biosynthesis
MLLVRNEENRWLGQYINQMHKICDRVVVLDDASTDKTPDILEKVGFEVHRSKESLWGTDELEQRKKLWNLTTAKAKDNDWILCLDADELLIEKDLAHIKYFINKLPAHVNSIGFRLFDMWNKTHFRQDIYWQAHFHMWPMAIRYKASFDYAWIDKKLHCGRFPKNSASAMLPTEIFIKHMGWSREEDRNEKYMRYMEADPNGVNGWLEQYKSILDSNPNLKEFVE